MAFGAALGVFTSGATSGVAASTAFAIWACAPSSATVGFPSPSNAIGARTSGATVTVDGPIGGLTVGPVALGGGALREKRGEPYRIGNANASAISGQVGALSGSPLIASVASGKPTPKAAPAPICAAACAGGSVNTLPGAARKAPIPPANRPNALAQGCCAVSAA